MYKMSCILMLIAISGCSTQKEFYATGGSRADGTVTLAYEYGGLQVPTIDPQQAHALAKQKCSVWGYTDAEPFGARQEKCAAYSGLGCVKYQVSVQYQCIGNLDDGHALSVRNSESPISRPPRTSLTKFEWQQQQVDELKKEKISYEEYQRRYSEIMSK